MKSMIEIENLDFVGSTFNEIACLHGENAAIQAGVAADTEWGEDELDMSARFLLWSCCLIWWSSRSVH